MRRWLCLSDAPDNFDNFISFMIAAIDAILVSQNVALAAESEGLGICYLGSTFSNCDLVGKILELPKNVVPVVGFTFGYPDEAPALRDRLPLDGLIHYDTYHDYSDEAISRVYQEKEVKGWERYMSYPRLQKLINDSGVKNLAQVYTEVKYPRRNYREISRKVLNYLQEQDFLD
jgi:hypothetical protein